MADPLSRLILHAKQPLPPGSSFMRQDWDILGSPLAARLLCTSFWDRAATMTYSGEGTPVDRKATPANGHEYGGSFISSQPFASEPRGPPSIPAFRARSDEHTTRQPSTACPNSQRNSVSALAGYWRHSGQTRGSPIASDISR